MMNCPNANKLITERLQEGLAQQFGTKVSPAFGLKLKDIPKVVRKKYGGLVRNALGPGGGFVNRYSVNVPHMGVYYAFVEPPTARDGHSEHRVSLIHYNSENLYKSVKDSPEFAVLALVQTIEMRGDPGPHLNLAIAKIARSAAQSSKFPAGKIVYNY